MSAFANIVTAQEAVTHIKSGDRVAVAHASAEPYYIIDAMVANASQYRDVEIVHLVAMGKGEYCKPEYKDNFRFNGIFLSGCTRGAVSDNRADFTPCFFHQVPSLWDTTLPLDVLLVTITPPDEEGYCSLGVSVDFTLAAVKKAKTIIAQVNDQMPYTAGQTKIHVSEVDYAVFKNAPILELPRPVITEVEEAIGRNCASLVEDGDTLQLGIGAIPDAVLMFLKDKKDLGIHSEMVSDGVMDLMKAGVVTNKRKNLHTGRSVATFLMGTKALYEFVDNNPDIEVYPVDYVNDPRVVCQEDHMVSINSCVEVDFMGQVNAEVVRGEQFSGIGGQVDFVRGATMSAFGRSIIAMPSSVKGKMSKIVPVLAAGTAVTTSRCDVDYVVTEYGIAALKGKTLRQRAQALIAIAHPNFKEELQAAFDASKRQL